MSGVNGDGGSGSGSPLAKLVAFYLPQFHPIPENDEWWGPGFTEWRNVMRAKPLFPGHYQPHVPGELGYYDLRVPEVREAQAQLAREHGIHGFCYYHYWFHGRRLLERPFDEVLASKSPDLPFMLCWANEDWTRNWDAKTGTMLMEQRYSPEDDLAHIRWLLGAFADERYITVDGRPVMLVYRTEKLPEPERLAELWRSEAQKAGFPDLYLVKVEARDVDPPSAFGFDASVAFMPRTLVRHAEPFRGFREHQVVDYETGMRGELDRPPAPFTRHPNVLAGWDNTARRRTDALVFAGASPQRYEQWLRGAVGSVADRRAEERLVFVTAWNEWAEGNHLEPDEKYGRAYLEATRRALGVEPAVVPAAPALRGVAVPDAAATAPERGVAPGAPQASYSYRYDFTEDSASGHVVALVQRNVEKGTTVVDLGAGAAVICPPLTKDGYRYHGMDVHPEAIRLMRAAGIAASQCDLTDPKAVVEQLDHVEGEVGALTLVDVVEHLPNPHLLVNELSAWARAHGSPRLFVSVPNVAHFDIALRLLCGRWDPTLNGLLDHTHLRFFYRETLRRMMERCGWRPVDDYDYHVLRSDQYLESLVSRVPTALYGALRLLSEQTNPAQAVQQYIWALEPVEVSVPPVDFIDAVQPEQSAPSGSAADGVGTDPALETYLASVGLFSMEGERRKANRELERQFRTVQLEERVRQHGVELARKDELVETLREQLQVAAVELERMIEFVRTTQLAAARDGAELVVAGNRPEAGAEEWG